MSNFYDRMAKKYGGYAYSDTKPKYTCKFSGEAPEEVFKERLLEYAKSTHKALDIGCGDGKFSFGIAKSFSEIIGLDSSRGLIDIAKKKKQELGASNVTFMYGDAAKTPFDDASFDIIFNRRGPSFYDEYARLLNKGGYYFEIGIGEKDTMELKKMFGRGQNYKGWGHSRLEADKAEFAGLGLEISFAEDFFYSETYESEEEFVIFLMGVPIFEDFDPKKDQPLLEKYFKEYSRDGKVHLERHRVVYELLKS